MIEIVGMTALGGERVVGKLPIAGTDVSVPMTLLCGAQEGKTVLITAGVHCAEYVGIQAAIELANELDPQTLCGNVVILPVLNRTGLEHRMMSVVYEDEKNLNRVFPGDPNGTMAEKIAWTVVEQLHKQADFYIDLHSGDGYEELTPYVYCGGAAAPETVRQSRAMAEQVDVPYLVVSMTASGGSYNYANTMGVPSILLERGCLGLWSDEEVQADKKDVRNVLRYLGVLTTPKEQQSQVPVDVGTVIYKDASHTGCWYPTKRAGDRVTKGELLGTVRDYCGNVLEEYFAEQDGLVLYQTASLQVLENGPMIAYSQLPRE
ncbi:MAG: M14 family metallopeptidase [Butyricicoccus sp.]